VREINSFVHDLIRAADPDSPWQFYTLLGVQWPQFALGLPTPVPDPRRQLPRELPLSIGTPSTLTLMNPVLETFHQPANVGCLGCHARGATALSACGGPLARGLQLPVGACAKRRLALESAVGDHLGVSADHRAIFGRRRRLGAKILGELCGRMSFPWRRS
jgi:hypothetical protein